MVPPFKTILQTSKVDILLTSSCKRPDQQGDKTGIAS